MSLQRVLQRPDVWRGSHAPSAQTISSGFPALDRLLPGAGWPQGALTEVLLPHDGIGEFRLLLPALVGLSGGERWIALIAPPYIPFAPALAGLGVDLSRLLLVQPQTRADYLWALENSLRTGACAAVLAWPPDVAAAQLRRWQLAAEAGGAWGALFQRRNVEGSPAALRVRLAPAEKGAVDLHILKRRGGWPIGPVRLEIDHALAMRAVAGAPAGNHGPRRAGA